MTQFYFEKSKSDFSVIIEDDGKVCYAYLLYFEDIISDVWLYNQEDTPLKVDWINKKNQPFLNPKYYIGDNTITPFMDISQVYIDWVFDGEKSLRRVSIYFRDKLFAILEPGIKPGWSILAKIDGPLAKKIP